MLKTNLLDSKINELTTALRDYKEELDDLYSQEKIDLATYFEVLEEISLVISKLIMDMRVLHETGKPIDMFNGSLPKPKVCKERHL